MDPTRLPDPDIRVDGRRLRASSYLVYAGAYQLTLSTIVAELALELHSSYLGHPDAPESYATHLELAPGRGPETWPEAHFGHEMPVADERQRCLLDHLAQLRELLVRQTEGQVTIDLPDTAVELIDHA